METTKLEVGSVLYAYDRFTNTCSKYIIDRVTDKTAFVDKYKKSFKREFSGAYVTEKGSSSSFTRTLYHIETPEQTDYFDLQTQKNKLAKTYEAFVKSEPSIENIKIAINAMYIPKTE